MGVLHALADELCVAKGSFSMSLGGMAELPKGSTYQPMMVCNRVVASACGKYPNLQTPRAQVLMVIPGS